MSTNPNVDVSTESTTAEAGFGESGPTSFDEMEAILDPSEEVEAKAEEVEEESSTSSEERELEEENADEIDAAIEEELKLVKAMRGENPYEVPEDAVFTQKVNGVDTEVTLRDLLNDYSGKTDWTKKYNELGKERQGFKKEKFEFDTRINTFVEKAKENKLDALAYLAETAGADPVEFIKEFKQGIVPDLEQYMNMSEAEREAYDSKQELDILKKSNETKKSMEARIQEQEALEAQVSKQIEELGVSQDEYVAAYDRLVASNTIPADQVGPEAVAQWIGMENRVNLIDQALTDIDANLAEDVALLEDLVRTSLQGGLDDQATLDVINELYGQPSKEAKSASKKVKQNKPNLKTVTNELAESDEDSGPISFDDI